MKNVRGKTKKLRGEMRQRNKEMFVVWFEKRLAPLDMMNEPRVWRDKPWTVGTDRHFSHSRPSD